MAGYSEVKMHGERGKYDRETLNSILDQSLIGHVSFIQDGRAFNIPMLFARDKESIILHASVKSRIYETLSNGAEICLAATLLDGIVVAKSAFHSSLNYRSAVVFGKARAIEGNKSKILAARVITEKIIRGRWDDCRHPSDSELNSTGFLRMDISDFSCKMREGLPVEAHGDTGLPYWSGVVSLATVSQGLLPSDLDRDKTVPQYIENLKTTQ